MMNFFKKTNKGIDTTPTADQQTSHNSEQTPNNVQMPAEETPANPQKPSIDTNDPLVQQIIRREARQLRMNEQLLTAPHLTRLEDSLRLNETKMENIEDNLARARKQLERVHHYQELMMELAEHKKHLYEVNKQMAASVDDRTELHRFEEFENVQGRYQRLTTLEQLRRQQKQRLSGLARDMEEGATAMEAEEKRLAQLRDEMREAATRFGIGLEVVGEAMQIENRLSYLSILARRFAERKTIKVNAQVAIDKEIAEQKRAIEARISKTEAIQSRRQSMQPHQRMAKHGELVVERLNRLSEMKTEVTRLQQQQQECQRKQGEENEMLGRIYSEYQLVEQAIQALSDELHVHRENNHGLESYRLQERAMQFKLRREMLISAQSLWVRIANGYSMIEDGLQAINSMRLKKENLTDKIEALDKELSILRRTCHEKEYTFTMSKSQNVIQLRGDLKEGTSCTVCGATHHPYHSDTMLEQNKLIGEFKMEYEVLASELRSKEKLLRDMQMEEAAVSAKKEEAENTLITLRQLQNGYVHDWGMFSHLDRSFAECDSTTNAPARTAMLRQLIENIGMDVEKAQKELDTFNYHQGRINELTEQIALQEQKKSELLTRLNEVNTGCQVMAVQLDHVINLHQTANDAYSRLFDTVDKMITIPDWQAIWRRSHEALTMRIQEITKEWNEITESLTQAEYERNLLELKMEHLQQKQQLLLAEMVIVDDDIQDNKDLSEEGEKKLDRLIGQDSSKQRQQRLTDDLKECYSKLETQQQKLLQAAIYKKEMAGRYDENMMQGIDLDEKSATERQGVDLWMRQYNANHPPVQYNELEEIFQADRNWNGMREHLRDIEVESLLTQARVDKLNSQMVALQAEGSINERTIDTAQHQLSTQIETLEARRREAMMTIATLTQQINTHHKAETLIKEDKMKE